MEGNIRELIKNKMQPYLILYDINFYINYKIHEKKPQKFPTFIKATVGVYLSQNGMTTFD